MVIARLHADLTTATIPIIVLTSRQLTLEEKVCLEWGVARLACKGRFSQATFVEQVRGLMELQMNTDERGWTLKHKDMHALYQSSSGMAAVTSGVSGNNGGMAQAGGAWHAAASH
jgi:hypothetical protein